MKLKVLVLLFALEGLCSAVEIPANPLANVPLHFEPAAGGSYVARAGDYAVSVSPRSLLVRAGSETVALRWDGGSPEAVVAPGEKLPGVSNYFIGADQSRWRMGVPHHREIRVTKLYRGIDAVYYGAGRRVEFDLMVAPGADPGQIRIQVDGPGVVGLNDGELVVALHDGEFRQLRPRIYQEAGGERHEVGGGYRMLDQRTVGFEIGEYDLAKPLIIDPVIVYSTYLGGSGFDSIQAVQVDAEGNIHVAGESRSPNFPARSYTAIPASPEAPGDVFVTTLGPAGMTIVSSAYFGGRRLDYATDIAIGVDGFIYVAGFTESADFPVTASAVQKTIGDDELILGDAFLVRLSPGAKNLMYSTYLGGGKRDVGSAVFLGPSGNMFITGYTESDDFPVSAGAYQTKLNADEGYDAFVARVNPAGGEIGFSTYLGGRNNDLAYDIAVDSDGHPYVTGMTLSPNFPVTGGAYQKTYSGGDQFLWHDAFVTKLRPNGTGLVFSTFLGGERHDSANAIAVDSFTHVYVAGETNSSDFPVVAPALQGRIAGGGASSDAFVTRLDRSGGFLGWSTYLGGTMAEVATAIRVVSGGEVTVAGNTNSTDFPVSGGECVTLLPQGGRDAFVARIGSMGKMVFSAYVGGTGNEQATGVAVDAAGNVYVGGETTSLDYPVTVGAYRSQAASTEGFITKLSPEIVSPKNCISRTSILNAASYEGGGVAPGEIIVIYGIGIGPPALASSGISGDGRFSSNVAETEVLFNDKPSPLIYVFETQLGAIAPYRIAGTKTAGVRVRHKDAFTNTVAIPVTEVKPAIFSLDSSGQGQGAVLHPDYSVNGPANPIERGGIVILYTTGEGQTDPPGQDGLLANAVYPKPRLPVTVRIGGIEAAVQYCGAAPGLTAGVMQVNVYVPDGVTPGDAVPVVLMVGNRVSQPGITIAVK